MWLIVEVIAGVMMFLYCLPLLAAGVISAGNICGFTIFLMLFLYARYFQMVNRFLFMKHRPWGFTLLILIIILLAMIILAVIHIGTAPRKTQSNGTLVVLGCRAGSIMADERIEAAVSYLKHHQSCDVIVTGGRGHNEAMSEAEYMRQKMIEAGIPATRIILEAQSRNTYENLANAAEIIQEKSLDEHIIIVSNEFHLYRAGLIADGLHLSHDNLSAPTAWWLFPTFFTREIMAVIKAWIF